MTTQHDAPGAADQVVAAAERARAASHGLALATRAEKDAALLAMADALRAREPEVLAEIEHTLAGFAHRRGDVSIIRFDHIATRRSGQRRFVDLHMHMPAGWTLGRAAALRGDVEQALMSAVPGLRATIQLLPSDVEAHFNDPGDPL